MEKYLIVVDLDNTLLNSHKEISEYSKEILSVCKEKYNCKIMVSTSRSFRRAIKYAKEINADYISSFAGNLIYDKDGQVIYKEYIKRDVFIKLVNLLKKNKRNDYFIFEGIDYSYSNCDKININAKFDSDYYDRDEYDKFEIFKILVCTQKVGNIDKLTKYIDCNYTFEENIFRIMPKGTDKYNGIKKVLNILKGYKTIVFGDDDSDYLSIREAYIGVKMANSIGKLRNDLDIFCTDNNVKDGVAKFLANFFNINKVYFNVSSNVGVLDCSLRDGGHLNNSLFGKDVIYNFINKLVNSGVDVIEVGFLENCLDDINRARYSKVSVANEFLKKINPKKTLFSLLVQADKFDINNLEKCDGKIKMIRVSFHHEYIDLGIKLCKKVLELGYLCSVNPINFSNYTKEDVIDLIKRVNDIKPTYFSIVDTFGCFLQNDFYNRLMLVDCLLDNNISIGIHLHDNLLCSFAYAQTCIDLLSDKRKILIDSSICGMGRTPGNLRTELITYYLNLLCGYRKYDMEYIYWLIQNEIPKLREKFNWEQSFEYSISAFEHSHRTYAEYLSRKHGDLKNIEKMIKALPEVNRGRFNNEISNKILLKWEGK